MGETREIWNWI